jgi:pimeloyl-ACP methyl ester carboxylesterase
MAQDILASCSGLLMVAGHSMGARVALEMVRQAPKRITKLVLLDTGMHPCKEGEEGPRRELVNLAYEKGMDALAERWLPPMVHPDRLDDQRLMDTLYSMVTRMTPELHERQITALLNRPDAESMISTIQCPTLLVVGRQDAWSPLSQHEDMRTRIPDANLKVIEEAGHFSPIERPMEVTNVLETWFAD